MPYRWGSGTCLSLSPPCPRPCPLDPRSFWLSCTSFRYLDSHAPSYFVLFLLPEKLFQWICLINSCFSFTIISCVILETLTAVCLIRIFITEVLRTKWVLLKHSYQWLAFTENSLPAWLSPSNQANSLYYISLCISNIWPNFTLIRVCVDLA